MSQAALSLDYDRAEAFIRQMTDGLVNIKDETGQFLLKLADGSIIDTKGWQGWEWTHGIALTALYHHSTLRPASESAQYSLKTAMDWFELQYKLSNGKAAPKNINTMSPFYCLSSLLNDGAVKDERWSQWCDEWAEWIMKDLPRTLEDGFQHMTYANLHENNLWDDTLMMTVIPLARIAFLLDRPQYLDEAIYQFHLHIQRLTHTPSGLWYHGWEYTPDKGAINGGWNFAGALWARGNCWITVSIPIMIEICEKGGRGMKAGSAERRVLEGSLRRQIDALLECQDEKTGMWHTLLVDPDSYLETSATAGFAAGIYAALRMGIVSGEKYRSAADRALAGVIANITPSGEVANVSFGTGMGYDFDFYRNIAITSMPYGQALAMMALVEWERLNGQETAAATVV